MGVKMEMNEALASLTTGELISAKAAGNNLPHKPGLYAIFIDDPHSLPEPFAAYLKKQNMNLIYVGKTTDSLFSRLFEQDFRHKSPSTFFRAIGPILGYRPPKGSLSGKANQNNYKFSPADTQAIIDWINEHLSIRYVVMPSGEATLLEPTAITTLTPLLNTQHNPHALPELKKLRDECRKIAASI